jgi:hypothetical protein
MGKGQKTGDRKQETEARGPNPNLVAAQQIYQVAMGRAEQDVARMKEELEGVRLEAQAMGVLKKIEYDQAHNELLKYVVLYRLREGKEYKKGGLNWEQFCVEILGETSRSVNLKIADIRPLAEHFGKLFSQLAGMPFNKIRLLGNEIGKNISQIEDGALVIDGARIALTAENLPEVEAAIEAMVENHQAEKKALSSELEKTKKCVNKVVAEETKALFVEREALIKENVRLKAFDPADQDRSWSVTQMEAVMQAALGFTGAVRKFSMDERIREDLHIQGQVEGLMAEVEKHLRALRQDWDETFNCEDGDI